MVQTSGIREKLRSNALKELAREKGAKRPRLEPIKAKGKEQNDSDSEDEEQNNIKQERLMLQARCGKNSLLEILPKPKNSSVFGPTVKLEKLLKLPERADVKATSLHSAASEDIGKRSSLGLSDDGMVEVDVRKVVNDDISRVLIKDLTVEKAKPTVIVPRGKEKQKNQITYLAQLGKATELERKELAAQGRLNKAAARSKYGW